MKCEKCGNIIEDKYIWCPTCGAKKPKKDKNISSQDDKKEEILFCKYCGSEIKTNSNYCNNCGNRLNDDINKNINNVNVYCECGQKLESGWKFCSNCKRQINFEIRNEQQETENNNKGINTYLILYAIFAGIYIFGSYFPYIDSLRFLAFIACIVTIITAKIKYPKNTLIKVLYWLTIAYLIFIVILTILAIIVCYETMRSCA